MENLIIHNHSFLASCNLLGYYKTKQHYVLGTDKIATPINTYNEFGFNLSIQNMSSYILMYSPIVFMDKSYQSLLEYYKKWKPSFSEKEKLNKVKFQFKRYFKSFLNESRDYNIILDLFDEASDKWSDITKTMALAYFNVLSKYIKDLIKCRKLSELFFAYAWINFTDKIYKELDENNNRMERDEYELTTRNAFSGLLVELIDGKCICVNGKWEFDANTKKILNEIGVVSQTYEILVFRHLVSILNKYKK